MEFLRQNEIVFLSSDAGCARAFSMPAIMTSSAAAATAVDLEQTTSRIILWLTRTLKIRARHAAADPFFCFAYPTGSHGPAGSFFADRMNTPDTSGDKARL